MRLQYYVLPVALATVLVSAGFAENQPISLSPRADQPTVVEQYPMEQQSPAPQNPQHVPSALNSQQHAGEYRFPATREELEQAAADCEKQVQALWSERNQLQRYRQPLFQRSIGDAQQRCRKLRELSETIKLADEQLYTYQQSLGQAERCFTAG